MSNIKYTSAEDALAVIKSGHRIYIHGSACTPTHLLRHLAARKDELRHVELVCISLYGEVYFTHPDCADSFHINAMFVSAPVRQAVNEGHGDYIPVFLSEIPELFKRGILPLDVALVQVSPPDKHGYCSLGPSVDIARTAVNMARYVIAQVNPQVPRTHGDSLIHTSRFHKFVFVDEPLQEVDYSSQITDRERQIARHVAGLIDDRSTLQMGVGPIPNAVLNNLGNHKDLGVHTEMFSDGLIPLFESDVINNRYKAVHPNKTVAGFALGSRALYDYIDDNPGFAFLDIDFVNEPAVIQRNPKVVAINSAIEVDLTGQVCADSIGTFQYSGVGGQMDFMRGAALSAGGKPVITLTARTSKGISRIVPFLKQGAGVVTTRAHVHYLVTEYGVAYLFGKNLRQRARALIEIAHPDDREDLERACHERFHRFE